MTCECWPAALPRAVTLIEDTECWPAALSRAGPGLAVAQALPSWLQASRALASPVLAHGLCSAPTSGAVARGSQALKHRLKGCGPLAQLLCGMWDLPGSGMESTSPALADLPLSHQGSRSTTLSLMKETKQLLN